MNTTDERPVALSCEVADLARQIDALPAEHRTVLLEVIRIEVIRMRMRRGRVERKGKQR